MKRDDNQIKFATKVLNQTGSALIDYAVILLLIVIISIVVIGNLETDSRNVFDTTTNTVKDFGKIR